MHGDDWQLHRSIVRPLRELPSKTQETILTKMKATALRYFPKSYPPRMIVLVMFSNDIDDLHPYGSGTCEQIHCIPTGVHGDGMYT
jgi:hypothetical protein